jgi:AcrR family transcriptional regulator
MSVKIKNKKEAIMESALELFTTEGFDNTSTASISKNAGVATGTLFTYFENKVDLINELYLSTKKELFGVLLPVEVPDEFTIDFARKIWSTMIRWGLDNPTKMRFIIQYSSSPYISKLTWDGIDAEMEMTRNMFSKAVDDGIIKDLSLDYLGYITTSHIYATIIFMITNGIDDDDFIERVFPTMWDMLKRS